MIFRNASHAFVAKLTEAMLDGDEVEVRGHRTRELLHQHITIENPLERVILVPNRRNDVFASVAETVWVLAGRNDLGYLGAYLPRADQYSDDGATWRAGYGPRIRDWHGVDQLAEVVGLLGSSSESRRAVMSIFDPATDFGPSRDIPCTNWLSIVVRQGRVDLSVAVRSNDLMWGFSGINTFEWSVLLEMLASWLGVAVGRIDYYVTSLHVYEYHWERARRIIAETEPSHFLPVGPAQPRFSTSFGEFESTLARWFELEQRIRAGATDPQLLVEFPDPLLRDFLWMLEARWTTFRADGEATQRALSAIVDPNLRQATSAQLS